MTKFLAIILFSLAILDFAKAENPITAVDNMTCSEAQRFVRMHEFFWKEQSGGRYAPVKVIAWGMPLPGEDYKCGFRETMTPFVVMTTDGICNVGHACMKHKPRG